MSARSTRTAALAGSDAARPEEYLTVAEVAARLKLNPKTVRNRMYDGTWRRGEHWFSRPGIGPRCRWSALVRWLEGGASLGRDAGGGSGAASRRGRPRRAAVCATS